MPSLLKVAFPIAGFLFVVSSHACLWDSDTLRNEATKFPELIDVATGRFERFPPLYYQMRLDRVVIELRTHPEKLEDYDDAAVACDRLGNDDAALAWMAKKRHELKTLGVRHDDATYKMLSNEGTFYVQKWFRNGRDPDDLSLIDKSLADLEAAVRLNPNAHFGREVIQIGAIEWVKLITKNPEQHPYLPREDPRQPVPLYTYLNKRKGFSDEAIQKGLTGLVVLGGGWESPDVFSGIKGTIPREMGVLGRLLDDRVEELVAGGISKLRNAEEPMRYGPYEGVLPSIDASYRLFRKAADDENVRRTDYMNVRMKQGRHPDTDPTFWNEWRPGPRPDFIDPPLLARLGPEGIFNSIVYIFCLSVAGILIFRMVRKFAARKERPIQS